MKICLYHCDLTIPADRGSLKTSFQQATYTFLTPFSDSSANIHTFPTNPIFPIPL